MNRMAPCAGYDFSAPILACEGCGAGFAGSALPARHLAEYYGTLSKYDTLQSAADISALDRERAAVAAAFIRPLAAGIGTALDVGCSAGVFLSKLRDAGVRDVRGIDPAAQAGDVARRLFGIDVACAQAESFDDYGRFDLVCLMAVLEHLLDPRDLLGKIARQMQPGARLLVEVPDAGAFDRPVTHEAFEPLGEFSNEHINFFAIGDLRRLALGVGLDVERWRSFRTGNGCPGLFALLQRRAPAPGLVRPEADSAPSRETSGESLTAYVKRSLQVLQQLDERLAACGDEVLIYGAGNHTARLMVRSAALASRRIRAVFDRNPNLQGASIGGVTILAPESLAAFPGLPIVISSFNASRDIETSLRRMTAQPVVALYPDESA